jgi:hypothetical protein
MDRCSSLKGAFPIKGNAQHLLGQAGAGQRASAGTLPTGSMKNRLGARVERAGNGSEVRKRHMEVTSKLQWRGDRGEHIGVAGRKALKEWDKHTFLVHESADDDVVLPGGPGVGAPRPLVS